MPLVSARNIEDPKMVVAPPTWVRIAIGVALVAIFALIAVLPIASSILKVAALIIYGVVLLGIARNALVGSQMATMQANDEGVYFQTDDASRYLLVPWDNIGAIEKVVFPVNKRGLRLEVTGPYRDVVETTEHVGNVQAIEDRVFIYTIPQLNDRDRLIDMLLAFKRGHQQTA